MNRIDCKENNRTYFVLKHKKYNIFFNNCSPSFYINEEWNKNDEENRTLDFSFKWDDSEESKQKLEAFLKSHKNLEKNFKIVKISEYMRIEREILED